MNSSIEMIDLCCACYCAVVLINNTTLLFPSIRTLEISRNDGVLYKCSLVIVLIVILLFVC